MVVLEAVTSLMKRGEEYKKTLHMKKNRGTIVVIFNHSIFRTHISADVEADVGTFEYD